MLRRVLDRGRRFLRLRHCYRLVYASPEGREVLQDILRSCRVNRSSHVRGDPYTTAYNEGKRAIGVTIGRLLNMSEDEALRFVEQQEDLTDE